MKRLLLVGFLPVVALLLLLGVAGLGAQPQPAAADQPKPPHHFLPELEGVPPAERFDHFRGAQFTITDAQGNAVTYQMTPGTVAGVSTTGGATTISVTPNGQTTAVGFTVTPDTKVHAMPNTGSLQALATGDKVMVLSRQGSDAAVMIAKHRMGMMGMGHGGMWE